MDEMLEFGNISPRQNPFLEGQTKAEEEFYKVLKNLWEFFKKKQMPVVGTLMSNMGLEKFFSKLGLKFYRADVGDKYVLKELQERKWVLGGEPSGHIICLDSTTTGDALIASLKILDSIKEINFDISKALENFNKFPQ